MAQKRKARSDMIPTPTEAILESISDGVFTVDEEWRITSFNRAGEEITGVNREEAIGQRCSEVFRSSICGPRLRTAAHDGNGQAGHRKNLLHH